MTEKRFVLTSEKIGKHWEILITDYQTNEPFNDVSYDATDNYRDTLDNMEDLCLLLNQIYKENEQLKDALNQRTDQCDNYYKKNKQLKKQIEHLERKIQRERKSAIKEHEKWEKETISLIREQRKFIDDLNKENEQLKEILNRAVKQMEIEMDKNYTKYFVSFLIDINMYKKIKEILND